LKQRTGLHDLGSPYMLMVHIFSVSSNVRVQYSQIAATVVLVSTVLGTRLHLFQDVLVFSY
jgi:hypothetical protein